MFFQNRGAGPISIAATLSTFGRFHGAPGFPGVRHSVPVKDQRLGVMKAGLVSPPRSFREGLGSTYQRAAFLDPKERPKKTEFMAGMNSVGFWLDVSKITSRFRNPCGFHVPRTHWPGHHRRSLVFEDPIEVPDSGE